MSDRARFARRLARNALLWLLPVAAAWSLATPFYNRFLTTAAENLVRLTESPSVTRLKTHDEHHFVVTRTDFPTSRGALHSVRTTDVHFPVILLAAFFLGVPGVPWRKRLENLAWALVATAFFHLLSLLFWVKFAYATQLGEWSGEHYGAFGQNFWGLGKHLLDLPLKFAWPLIVWAAFYIRRLLPAPTTSGGRSAVEHKNW